MINAATQNINTKSFMHTTCNRAISATPLCKNRASVCLSLLMFHTEPKSLPLLNGAFYNLIYVYFMWC